MLANHFAGSLRQFYHGQAQLAGASGLPQWAKSVDRGDHQLRYVSQFGSETVTLAVHPKVVEEVLKKEELETPWDWAVVDFEVPLVEHDYNNPSLNRWIGGISGFYIRCRQVPFERDPISGIEMGGAGFNIAYYRSGEGMTLGFPYDPTQGEPLLALEDAFLPEDTPVGLGPANIDKKSVRIDLRKFPKVPELTFEVYANLYTPTDDTVDVYAGKYQGALLTGLTSSTFAPDFFFYNLKVHEDFSLGLVYELYPELAALPPETTDVDILQPDGPEFGNSEAAVEAWGFSPSYFSYDLGEGSHIGQYFFDAPSGGSIGWALEDVAAHQAMFLPAKFGETVNPVGVPELGVGIYKWQDTAWDYFPTSSATPSGTIVSGIVNPTPPAQEVAGVPPDNPSYFEYTNYIGYTQFVQFIFLPVYNTVVAPVTVNSTMTVSATMFRGTPPWEAPPYDIPSDPGEWAYSQWQIKNQSPRFGQKQIGEVSVEGVQLDTPVGVDHYYEPEVQREGRPYIGRLVVSPTKGYAVFKSA